MCVDTPLSYRCNVCRETKAAANGGGRPRCRCPCRRVRCCCCPCCRGGADSSSSSDEEECEVKPPPRRRPSAASYHRNQDLYCLYPRTHDAVSNTASRTYPPAGFSMTGTQKKAGDPGQEWRSSKSSSRHQHHRAKQLSPSRITQDEIRDAYTLERMRRVEAHHRQVLYEENRKREMK